jgi:hypothetical protein
VAWVRTQLMKERNGGSRAPRYLLGTLQDVTAVHQNELALHQLRTWLESLGEALPFEFWIIGGRRSEPRRASLG